MTDEELKRRHEEMEAEIAANEAADREHRKKVIRTLVIIGVVLVLGIGGYMIFKPEYVPEVYYDSKGNIDYDRQYLKLEGEHKYKEIQPFRHGYAVVGDGKKFGLCDVKGNLIIPIKYDEVGTFNDPYLEHALVRQDSLYGLCDKAGKETVKCVYNEINFNGETMKVKRGNEEFYIDYNDNKVDM